MGVGVAVFICMSISFFLLLVNISDKYDIQKKKKVMIRV